MSDEQLTHGTRSPGEPPAGGRTNHDSMRRAAELPVQGPASTEVLAAGGGLEMPGRDRTPHAGAATNDASPSPADMIPGAREADTLTHREAGAIGGQFTGMDIPPDEPKWLDERTASEHLREGGDAHAGRGRKGDR